jgi:hypothetical protein
MRKDPPAVLGRSALRVCDRPRGRKVKDGVTLEGTLRDNVNVRDC